jgi:hypothetical protein
MPYVQQQPYQAPSATVFHFGYADVIQYQGLFVGAPI